MEIIRKLYHDDYRDFLRIAASAYPGAAYSSENTVENYISYMEKNVRVCLYGLFRDCKLLGGIKLNDFVMQLHSTRINAGGIGMLCVDLLHKKEKVAMNLLSYSIKY